MGKQTEFASKLRYLVRECYKDDGSIGISKKQLWEYKLSQGSEKVLEELVYLVMKTRYFAQEEKDFLLGESFIQIQQKLEANGRKINVNSLKSRIYYQINRLKKELGEDALEEICRTKSNDILKHYYKKIKQLEKGVKSKSLLDNLLLKVPEVTGERVTALEEEDAELLMHIVTYHSKAMLEIVQPYFTSEMASYLKYLESKDKKEVWSQQDKEVFSVMQRYLGEDDYR